MKHVDVNICFFPHIFQLPASVQFPFNQAPVVSSSAELSDVDCSQNFRCQWTNVDLLDACQTM